ncbi:MAG: TlyA family RNA methyltransferase [Patescibacteria group bacterium]
MEPSHPKKQRLDLELTTRKLVESRSQGQTLIRAGEIFVNEQRAITPSQPVKSTDKIIIKEPLKYVSRGGLKLEHALKEFKIIPQDMVCMDIGASTGGFTDCLLQNGAQKVYAIDVGHGQLADKLKKDPRVISTEKQNFRLLEKLPDKIDLFTIDVSFISLTIILDHLKKLLPSHHPSKNVTIICLLKPQFEASKKNLKKGVVRDPKIHQGIINLFKNFCQSNNFQIKAQTTSPIKGPKGNIEFLFHLTLSPHKP